MSFMNLALSVLLLAPRVHVRCTNRGIFPTYMLAHHDPAAVCFATNSLKRRDLEERVKAMNRKKEDMGTGFLA